MATPALGPSSSGTAHRRGRGCECRFRRRAWGQFLILWYVADEGVGGAGGFFHYIADLAGEGNSAFAGNTAGFNEEDFAAERGV